MPKFHDTVQLDQAAAPATPPAGRVELYAKTNGGVYTKDPVGLEQSVGGVFVQQSDPAMVRPGLWFETDASGNLVSLWVQV